MILRPNLQEVVNRLESIGADLVVTDEAVSSGGWKLLSKLCADKGFVEPFTPQLALNCVGGSSAVELSRVLADGGSLITYGGMSKKPVQVPTGRFIFNDIHLHGFWLSRWTMQHTKSERLEMINALTDLIRTNQLRSFTESLPFSDITSALIRAHQPFRDVKVVLDMAR